MDRRYFLRTSAALTAGLIGFPYIVRASALGKAGAVAPSNRLTLAQIGCGGMGDVNLRSFLGIGSELQVIAVCDVDDRHSEEKKKMVDEKYGNNDCKTYRDFREMLDREQIDIVSHALPDHWHAAVTMACVRRGIDIYGEKPFSRSIAEGRAMCDAIKHYGCVWQTGSWQRSVAQFRQAAELVRNGRLGRVGYVEVGGAVGSPRPKAQLR
jgi:predicted dehydrogenase